MAFTAELERSSQKIDRREFLRSLAGFAFVGILPFPYYVVSVQEDGSSVSYSPEQEGMVYSVKLVVKKKRRW